MLKKVSKFPRFSKLSLTHQKTIIEFNRQFAPYSDFNFTSLWSYNINSKIVISNLNDNLVVKFDGYFSTKPFFSIIGNNNIIESIDILYTKIKSKKMLPYLKLIPEYIIKKNHQIRTKYRVKTDKANYDYILKIKSLNYLLGKKFEKKRWRIKKFIKDYPHIKYKVYNRLNDVHQFEICKNFYSWENSKNKKRKHTIHEFKALKRLILSSDNIKFNTIIIYNKNKIVGFSIFEKLANKYAIGHFLKADASYKRIFEYLIHVTGKHLFYRGCQYLNIEQDLGDDFLRSAKRSWRPVKYLKKYDLIARTQP